MNFPRLFSLLLGACPSKKAPRLALNAVRSRSRPFSISSPRPVLPKAIAEATVFHDAMTQSFRDARLPLEPKQDEVFTGDYYSLSIDGAIVKGPAGVLKKDICKMFSLSPRDLRLLDGRAPMTFSPTFLVRPQAIVYASSVLRAVITPEAVHIVAAGDENVEGDQRLRAEEVCESLKTTMGLGVRDMLLSSTHKTGCSPQLPFELRALEAVLYRLNSGYAKVYQKLYTETWAMFESLQSVDSAMDTTHEELRLVGDARRALDDFAARARSLQQSVSKLLREDDHDLAGLYLTAKLVDHKPRETEDHEEAELMLEGILRRQDEVVASAELLGTDIVSVQKLMELGMAATRNRLLYLEIKLDLAMLAISISAAVFAAFGMNLTSGLEEAPGVFYLTCGLCCLGTAAVLRSGIKALNGASKRRYLADVLTRRRRRKGLIAPEPVHSV